MNDRVGSLPRSVVRWRGRWWRADLPSADPVEVAVEDVVALAGASVGQAAPRRPSRRIVAPVAVVIGRVVGSRLEATAGPSSLHLDVECIRVLDALRRPVPECDVAPDDPRRAALDRLLAVGLVRDVSSAGELNPDSNSDGRTTPTVGRPAPAVRPIRRSEGDERIPVYTIWHAAVGPMLSLGMLTAAARYHDGGVLNRRYDIRPPEEASSALADLATRRGPAVLLCSDYVFTLELNLRTARSALAVNSDLLVVHGGPSSPRFDGDIAAFLERHGDVAHVLARGEGERTVCEVLEVLAGSLPSIEPDRLGRVDGIAFRHPRSGAVVRTPERQRIADLDSLPSPYLTGEFDHIPPEDWTQPPFFETNRGCPYGCTFCDWGSATRSRIRKFDLDRVEAELDWAGSRGLRGAFLCDANFGIFERDVEVAERMAAVRRRHGVPEHVMFSAAKNTTKHLSRIFDVLSAAGIEVATSISLQTTDAATLDAVGRHNISTDAYLELAADLRRRGHALTGDLILGLPGQTYDSFKSDMQFMFDHEIMPRTFPLRLLPNAPMNAPDYRSEHGIQVDSDGSVIATSTLSPAHRARGLRLRNVSTVVERNGVLRHVMRFLQWDHGIRATDVMDVLVDVAAGDVSGYPSLTWLLSYFDLFPVPLAGWTDFYRDVRRLILDRFDVSDDGALECVLTLQEFLMPVPRRSFPDSTHLRHDYLAYYTSATGELYRSGHAGRPDRPLAEYGPGTFTVDDDPLDLCGKGLEFPGESRDRSIEGDFAMGSLAANELDSPLVRILPCLAARRRLVERKLATAMSIDREGIRGPSDRAVTTPVVVHSRPCRVRPTGF